MKNIKHSKVWQTNNYSYSKILYYIIPILFLVFAIYNIVPDQDIVIKTTTSFFVIFILLFSLWLWLYNFNKKILTNNHIKTYNIITILTNIVFLLLTLVYHPYVFLFIIFMILSILLHEVWHLIFFTLNKVKIVEFSIWFWEKITWFKWKWIEWNIRNIFLGGFVRPIDDTITEIKELWNTTKTDNKIVLSDILQKYNLKKENLYITKRFWQKFLILTWWVLMNLILSIIFLFSAMHITNTNSIKELTHKQIEGINKLSTEYNTNKDIYKYLNKKVWNSMWLWKKTSNTNTNTVYNTIYEINKWLLLTLYSLDYAIHNPDVFMQFKSIVWIWKDIGMQEKYDLMNLYMLFLICALVNISLFVVNLLPLPALDGWQLFKELIWHIIKKFNEAYYYNFAYSKTMFWIEMLSFYWLTLFWIIIILKDIIT